MLDSICPGRTTADVTCLTPFGAGWDDTGSDGTPEFGTGGDRSMTAVVANVSDGELASSRRQALAFRPTCGQHRDMTKYLITFPAEALVVPDEEFPIVEAESRAVMEEAKAAGVYVFGGGINEDTAPVLVSADGSVGTEIYPGSRLTGGFTVLELPTRADAVEWARKIAVACRCAQELREFHYDPAS